MFAPHTLCPPRSNPLGILCRALTPHPSTLQQHTHARYPQRTFTPYPPTHDTPYPLTCSVSCFAQARREREALLLRCWGCKNADYLAALGSARSFPSLFPTPLLHPLSRITKQTL
eukprot:2094875-Rhodomonas_salina.1